MRVLLTLPPYHPVLLPHIGHGRLGTLRPGEEGWKPAVPDWETSCGLFPTLQRRSIYLEA
jgi:hypothetical protein